MTTLIKKYMVLKYLIVYTDGIGAGVVNSAPIS
jgi:hypothetical protein